MLHGFVLSVLIAVSGCSSRGSWRKEVHRYEGATLAELVELIGVPDQTLELDDQQTVYEWDIDTSAGADLDCPGSWDYDARCKDVRDRARYRCKVVATVWKETARIERITDTC